MNFIPVQVRAPLTLHHALFQLTLPEQWASVLKRYDAQMISLGIRPEHLSVSDSTDQTLLVAVDLIEALGHETVLSVRLADNSDTMQVRITPDRAVKLGEALRLALPIDKIHLFDQESGNAIVPELH
ncbi:TOBE domain-containing protein [Leptolyngbya boryana]